MSRTGRQRLDSRWFSQRSRNALKPPQRLLEWHGEDIAQFAIEIIQIALRVIDCANGDIRQFFEAFGEQAQDDALAAARIAVNHGKAAFANLRMFNAPAEVLNLRRHIDRFGWQLGGEGIPFQPIEGE